LQLPANARLRITALIALVFAALSPLKVLNRDFTESASSLIYSLRMRNTDSHLGPGEGDGIEFPWYGFLKNAGLQRQARVAFSRKKLLVRKGLESKPEVHDALLRRHGRSISDSSYRERCTSRMVFLSQLLAPSGFGLTN
jgi:hypothetical protein